jgi:hypothetical protein
MPSSSRWNFTPSPGWTADQAATLKLCLMRLGVGRWVQIQATGLLPGKMVQQLNGQTQRLLGQQSLAAYTGLQVRMVWEVEREGERERSELDVGRTIRASSTKPKKKKTRPCFFSLSKEERELKRICVRCCCCFDVVDVFWSSARGEKERGKKAREQEVERTSPPPKLFSSFFLFLLPAHHQQLKTRNSKLQQPTTTTPTNITRSTSTASAATTRPAPTPSARGGSSSGRGPTRPGRCATGGRSRRRPSTA